MAALLLLLLLFFDLSLRTGFFSPSIVADAAEMDQRRGIVDRLPLRERLAENTTSSPPSSGILDRNESNGANKTNEANPPPPIEQPYQTNASDSTGTKQDDSRPHSPIGQCEEKGFCENSNESIKACLRIPGDGTHITLSITYNTSDGEDRNENITVSIVAPEMLIPDPKEVYLHKEITATIQLTVNPKIGDSEIDVEEGKQMTIEVSGDKCQIKVPVPVDFLRGMLQHKDSRYPSSAAFANPMLRAILLFLLVSLVSATAWLCYKFGSRNHPMDTIRHQQLEMTAPESPHNLIEEATDGWDETWDDDWDDGDDTEAAKSSSLLRQNLSSRGLAARRVNKDGWDD